MKGKAMSGEPNRTSSGQVTTVPTTVSLTPSTSLDLSWLPEEERKALLVQHTRGVLDIAKKANELHVDVAALKAMLDTSAGTVRDLAADGTAVTITNTNQNSLGRTEIIMGNTDQARTGKLTRSQTGEFNWNPVFIAVAVVAVLILAAILTR
jgi:hypothetical protein